MRMMKMKNKLFVLTVQVIIFLMGVKNSIPTTTPKLKTKSPNTTTTRPLTTTTPRTTTGSPGVNLKGKMFTLTYRGGEISLYSPHFSAPSSTPTYRTHSSATSTHPPWTTVSPNNGVSVCLRYITDYLQTTNPAIFTLSPSTNPLRLTVSPTGTYSLYRVNDYNYLYLTPSARFWPNIKQDFWTSVCLTMDMRTKVAQMFKGPNMSIRKVLPFQYVWSGEPVINFSGFDGQVTDVQVWDYPLRYGEIYNYMTYGVYGSYSGSVLSWSSVSYSITGYTLLEDAYEWQDKKPFTGKAKGRELKGNKKTRKFVIKGEDMDKQQI